MDLNDLYQKALRFEFLTVEEGMYLFENAALTELTNSVAVLVLPETSYPTIPTSWDTGSNPMSRNSYAAGATITFAANTTRPSNRSHRLPAHARRSREDLVRQKTRGSQLLKRMRETLFQIRITEPSLSVAERPSYVAQSLPD